MALPPHVPIAIKVLPHLIECAKSGRRTNYEEMGKAVGMGTHMFSRPLVFIRDFICARHNLPPLTVLVEKRGGNTATNAFDPEQFAALSTKDYNALEQEMLKKVYEYPNWDRALIGLRQLYSAV